MHISIGDYMENFMFWITPYVGFIVLIFRLSLAILAILTMVKIMRALDKYMNK